MATVRTPNSWADRKTRMAISLRLATSSFLNGRRGKSGMSVASSRAVRRCDTDSGPNNTVDDSLRGSPPRHGEWGQPVARPDVVTRGASDLHSETQVPAGAPRGR